MALTTPGLIAALAPSEGFRAKAYDDKQPWLDLGPGDEAKVKGVVTYGHGLTTRADGTPVKLGDIITEPESLDRMVRHVRTEVEPVLANLIHVPLAGHQYDALAHAMYQYGGSEMSDWRLIRLINDDAPWTDIAKEWINGTVMFMGEPLFWTRRVKEILMFFGLDWRAAYNIPFGSDLINAVRTLGFSGVLPRGHTVPDDDVFDDMEIPRRSGPASAGRTEPPDMGPGGDKPAAESDLTPIPEPLPPVLETEPVTTIPETKPPSVWTVRPDAVPYRIDPEAGLKPLEDSDRVKGYVWQSIGRGVVRAGSLGMFGTTFSGVFSFLQSDAVLLATFMELFVPAAVALSTIGGGYAIKAYGDWKRTRGEEAASQGLF